MPMDKARYPANWKDIALSVKEKAGWRCEQCGMQCRTPGESFDTHKRTLTVHHKDHVPENCELDNLIALCPKCHLRADAEWHVKNRRKRNGFAGERKV